ncbi:MAG: hypothetical protein WC003_11305 [Terrimicrobiaceae bacterium]
MKPLAIIFFVIGVSGLVVRAEAASVAAEPGAPGGTIPPRYSAVSSAVMQYRWFKFPALGVITVDVPKRHFALVGLSQIGLTVFELSETGGHLKSRMPGTLLKRHPQIAEGAAADVRQMFFDLVPPDRARPLPRPRGNATVFRIPAPGGTLEYRFETKTGALLEKRFSVPRKFFPGSRVVWQVLFEDYAAVGRNSCPRIIRFKQRARHYAIALFFKEIRITP